MLNNAINTQHGVGQLKMYLKNPEEDHNISRHQWKVLVT